MTLFDHMFTKSKAQRDRESAKAAKDFMTSTFGFAWDSLKAIFKLTPDHDQGIFDFLIEKMGAFVIFAIGFSIIAVVAGVLIIAINPSIINEISLSLAKGP